MRKLEEVKRMKKGILIAVFLMVASPVFADCTGEVVDFYEHQTIKDGRIIVEVQYSIDEEPEANTDKWTIFPDQLTDTTKEGLTSFIESRIDEACKSRIVNEWRKKAGALNALKTFEVDLKAISRNITEVEVNKDKNKDGYYEEKWTLTTDGRKSVTALDPVIAVEK